MEAGTDLMHTGTDLAHACTNLTHAGTERVRAPPALSESVHWQLAYTGPERACVLAGRPSRSSATPSSPSTPRLNFRLTPRHTFRLPASRTQRTGGPASSFEVFSFVFACGVKSRVQT
eukprot:3501125-Rhodomonas_salina.3